MSRIIWLFWAVLLIFFSDGLVWSKEARGQASVVVRYLGKAASAMSRVRVSPTAVAHAVAAVKAGSASAEDIVILNAAIKAQSQRSKEAALKFISVEFKVVDAGVSLGARLPSAIVKINGTLVDLTGWVAALTERGVSLPDDLLVRDKVLVDAAANLGSEYHLVRYCEEAGKRYVVPSAFDICSNEELPKFLLN